MNGEPLFYDDLTRFLDLANNYNFNAVLDTNGTVTQHRAKLVHPALKVIRITISAATEETYHRVHGLPFMPQALDTIVWLQRYKLPHQELWLHFIENTVNTHEREQWLNRFYGINRTVWPIHANVGQPQSMDLQTPSTIFSMRANSIHKITYPYATVPCQCWNILVIGHDGTIQQCSDVPRDVNYGRVGEVDLFDAWRRRNQNAMQNKYCQSCNLRLPHAEALFKKHGFTGET